MDVHISRWILEFLLRQPIEKLIINRLLDVLPISKECHFLEKLVLIKRISSEVNKGSISEATLESLEILEQYYYQHGIPVLDSLSEAYCAVAVHCTVMHLKLNSDDCRNYFDTVIRIWRGRIRDMEGWEKVGLVSDRLKKSRDEIEEALWRVSVRDNVLTRDTLSDALKSLRIFLAEAAEEMGPSFLEVAAKALMQRFEEVGVSSNPLLADQSGGRQAYSADPSPERADVNNGNHLEHSGSHIAEEADEMGPSFLKAAAAAAKRSKGKEVKVSRSTILADQTGEGQTYSADAPPEATVFSNGKHLAHRRSHIAVDSTNEIPRASHKKYNVVSTPDVRKVQEALNSSAVDLQTVVTDPLPDALRVAATISSCIAREETMDSLKNRNVEGTNICVPSVDEGIEAVRAKETNPTNKSTVSRPSLMDKSKTTYTFEWSDDSVQSSSEGSQYRPRLRTPKRKIVSPLDKYGIKKGTRRRKKFWTPEEEQALRDAIEECGAGRWKFILNKYGDIFEDRTDGDLRDKWRNMIK